MADKPDFERWVDEVAKAITGIEDTYRNIYLLWNPGRGHLPTGRRVSQCSRSEPAREAKKIGRAASRQPFP